MAGLAGAGAGDHHDVLTEAADAGRGMMEAAVSSVPAVAGVHGESTPGDTPLSVSINVPASRSGLHSGIKARTSVAGAVPDDTEVQQPRLHAQPEVPRSDSTRERDRRFDQFKTFNGGLERQLSSLRRVPEDPSVADSASNNSDDDVPTADRYFAALEGPELDTLRVCTTPNKFFFSISICQNHAWVIVSNNGGGCAQPTEVAVLPKDEQWPFLLRFPISAFGMCLGVNSQAMLWKTLETEPSMAFLHVHPTANYVFWWVSVALTVVVSITYLLKVVFYYEAVRREFHHPVRVNFFFAPWIACLFLVKGEPRPVWEIHHVVYNLLMLPILCLDLKIYGQWMSSGERRLSKVANPSNHLAVVGNFVGALLGAKMGLTELPIFFFGVGLAHYAVLFVTLYQRLPTNVQLPKELHPVFFLFVAAPSVASMAWARISGEFSDAAKLLYFVSLFLYVSLVVRINLFTGFRFSLAWWAYTFPMTSVALATALYASEVDNLLTRALAVGLSAIAVVTVTAVLATTVYHAFVRGDLFPNDVSIAITRQKPKFSNILTHIRSSGSDVKDLVLSIPNFNSNSKHSSSSSSRASNNTKSGTFQHVNGHMQ
ncbi:S-type anion channel SLAH2 [Hordeum vulgare]|nr:S-type anion channel SLAH2 [Hordeum vulgare]